MPRDGEEIGLAQGSVRRKRAKVAAAPSQVLPASAPIEPVETPVRKRRAKTVLTPTAAALGVSPIHETVKELVSLQRKRVLCITAVSRSERSIEALIATTMGYRLDDTDKERQAVFARAKTFRLAVEKGGEGQGLTDTHCEGALSAIIPLIIATHNTVGPWLELRKSVEAQLIAAAAFLPVCEFAKSVRGFGPLGLACFTAEAGIPIGEYKSVSALWKRMGVAVFSGKRQQKIRGKDEAELNGYSPRRRAELWAFTDSMFRNQWAGDKDEDGKDPKKTGKPIAVPAHAVGPYGEVYGRRREHTKARIEATADLDIKDPEKWTSSRCNNDARRVMSKALLRDLWRVWNGMPPRGSAEAIGDAQ